MRYTTLYLWFITLLSLYLYLCPGAEAQEDDYYDEDSYYYEEDEEEGYEEDYMGPECYDPDGLCTSTRIGNIRYGYDGTSSQRVGKRTYHSNGVVCTTIRNTTYCAE